MATDHPFSCQIEINHVDISEFNSESPFNVHIELEKMIERMYYHKNPAIKYATVKNSSNI